MSLRKEQGLPTPDFRQQGWPGPGGEMRRGPQQPDRRALWGSRVGSRPQVKKQQDSSSGGSSREFGGRGRTKGAPSSAVGRSCSSQKRQRGSYLLKSSCMLLLRAIVVLGCLQRSGVGAAGGRARVASRKEEPIQKACCAEAGYLGGVQKWRGSLRAELCWQHLPPQGGLGPGQGRQEPSTEGLGGGGGQGAGGAVLAGGDDLGSLGGGEGTAPGVPFGVWGGRVSGSG